MATKKTSKKTSSPKKQFVLLFGILVLVVGVILVIVGAYRFNQGTEQALSEPIRELILSGAEGTQILAPIDEKTGDAYFPPAGLYLPNAEPTTPLTQLTYSYGPGVDSKPELSISSKAIFRTNAARLYTAKDMDELHAAIPRLQACQRGIQVVYEQLQLDKNQMKYIEGPKLANGKTIHMYFDKRCPELNTVAQSLKALKPY